MTAETGAKQDRPDLGLKEIVRVARLHPGQGETEPTQGQQPNRCAGSFHGRPLVLLGECRNGVVGIGEQDCRRLNSA